MNCFHCEKNILSSCTKYHCESCGRLLCENCAQSLATVDTMSHSNFAVESVFNIKSCKLCFELSPLSDSARRCSGKVYPRDSPEPPSPSFSGERFGVHSPSSPFVHRSPSRSDEDEGEESTSQIFGTSSEYYRDTSDVDSSSIISARHEQLYSFTSVGSSPSDSPSRIHITSNRVGHYVQTGTPTEGPTDEEQAILEKPTKGIQELPKPLDFETNGLIWFPPPPDDMDDDTENSFFTYDDEDDEIGDSGADFSPTSSTDTVFLSKEKQQADNKEPLRAAIEGHFRALVSQLLQGEGIIENKEKCAGWVDIVTAIAWQAANFIKPDTSRGGSMDPCDYIKVKCVASGIPLESKLIKGVVCTKNIKHKRMTSQYKNTRLLLLGGALEYQRVPNQLASFNTLLQQENDHLKTIVLKIEAHRPNVLLVEKSVSSFAQEQLLAKDISLVLNVKRPLLERIARCTGATITPSTDLISTTRLGHCELFHLEKISEDHESVNQFKRKPSKTLMFFEGCPRRLGCTVVLRGSYREELKKVKHVVQYAIFAAYHLSLETSFLADEGASLPKLSTKSSHVISEKTIHNKEEIDASNIDIVPADLNLELGLQESLSELGEASYDDALIQDEFRYRNALLEACDENLALNTTLLEPESGEASMEYYSGNESHQSILVSFSSHCMLNGTVCERSRLLRVKFYGPSDKPLGRYLRDDLFDQSSLCGSCKESAEAHVVCYTHQHGNLTINVRRLPSVKLPGEQDGKIWMWHRCLRCAHIEGIPPATPRVVMSDAAWGLSFGKFLELSFSNHATGNRIANCGHSLQRDCLRFYGFGSMVAFFRYSPINILDVHLPRSMLEFDDSGSQIWIRKEAAELLSKAEALYGEISGVLQEMKHKSLSCMHEFSDANELHNHVLELNDMLDKEKSYCEDLLQETPDLDKPEVDILEINRLRHSLLMGSHVWDRRLYLLDSLLKRSSSPKAPNDALPLIESKDCTFDLGQTENISGQNVEEYPNNEENYSTDEDHANNSTSLERLPSAASILSDTIDSAWSGADQATVKSHLLDVINAENPSIRRVMSPTRVYSFDSAQRLQDRVRKGLTPSSLSTIRSFHASGDFRHMIRDPISNVQRTHSQVSHREVEKLNLSFGDSHSFISSISLFPQGARFMVPHNDIVIAVYDNEPTSIISYALSSKEYDDWICDRPSEGGGSNSNVSLIHKVNSLASDLSTWQSFGSLDLDYMQYGNYNTREDSSSTPKSSSPHVRISFEDDSNGGGKVKFSVTCYFAKQFDALRRRCCPSEVDFIRSLSRCKRWSAQGGKSNVYFAKSFDERFIIKQVTRTELESFDEFAPEYFKYLTGALSSGSPTCLAKVLGIYQVIVKHSKGGKEIKMDLMVMENLFYKRNISRVYDLKGSARSRYNADTTGPNKVLLDMNLLETLRTNPIFLGSKAKRILERAVWNDTSFLASVDVMDYSLLVGIDEERKELVLGIIDFMRQYTWDKHLETWVKASGILGGPKNASPTIISPKQYKKRFRKAMTNYFLTVPDQWSS
ncbi:hypothetical protein RD792_011396 [Penstemon davidsonii]|uniref:1-phosphatidylinositol-3-phosphate 5-kinase n=1 Tax=Penstemon davidsonii TaxID=160366 RepID=A0ABR0D4M5_9LAMI|nr:hypothetical protein RD792_011396 [Penstemon davidsonii]